MSAWSWVAPDVRPPWRPILLSGLMLVAALALLAAPGVPWLARAAGVVALLVGIVWQMRPRRARDDDAE